MGGAHHFIDAQGDSRRLLVVLDGRIKLVLLAAALLVNLTAGGLLVPLLLAALALVLVMAAGVRAGAFFRRMAIPALLAAVALATQLFWFREGAPLFSIPLLFTELTIHAGGVLRGLELAARILGGMGVLLFFSLTTPLPELMRAAQFFRCPPVLVELALIMYRYIFLLLEEGGRIRNAQKARLGFVGFRAGLRSSGILGGMLILRTCDRAERSFAAMRCRGYRGAPTGIAPGRLQGRDWGAFLAGLVLLGTLFAMR
ncbi:cobalt ECF transporter T component CbiQ [Desulfuromonas versatilis]|uniref:Cobalt ECF transporter T component CbiQ n=1 Tax=Desulfuromonas versatilis TaxID=2802975 RepID=A0ABM8HS11_9BACT|nr:cobalt ECF transporter T component CbiQ [Desulfuromonas versatilis]BCR03741.1 cobalt ECF transporter T component CbiQ [Desulfuromonas versatilis]